MVKKNFLILLVTVFWMSGVIAQNERTAPNLSTNATVNSFIVGTSCGSTISSLTSAISTPIVSGVTTYTFRVTNLVSGAVQVINRPVNSFSMSNYPGMAYNTAYNVEVSVNGGLTYGTPCLLYTPLPICTIGAQCSTTLDSMTQFVYCTYVVGVLGYRFKITNTVNNTVQIFDSLSNRFYFNQLASKAYSTIYLVEVAVKNGDGNYLPYNTGCTITTPGFPTTMLQTSQCKTTVTSFKQNIYAEYVTGASDYRFLVSRAGFPTYNASIDRPLTYFTMNMFTGLLLGTTYSVRVAVKIGGEWGPYGPACHITTSGMSLRINESTEDFKAIAYPNPFATDFKLNISSADESTIQLRVYDMMGKQIENENVGIREIENLHIGSDYTSGVYNVVVSQGENSQTLRIIKR